MKIFTGTCGGEYKLGKVEELKLGIMVSPSVTKPPNKDFSKFKCCLDNGAFRNWQRGYPFMESSFFACMEKCHKVGIDLHFIVCPDIVTGGKDSLAFSMEYARTKLKTAQNLALAVQDGVTPKDVSNEYLGNFTHIFVGGTREWKWETADEWVKYAHSKDLKCHIGRCGTLDRLEYARDMGADSVDSTNMARNDSWNTIERLYGEKKLF